MKPNRPKSSRGCSGRARTPLRALSIPREIQFERCLHVRRRATECAPCYPQTKAGAGTTAAFTLTDLLVVCAVLALLVLMLAPAGAASRTKSQSIRCLDNLRQLMGAVMLYTRDNHDLFPPNPDDGTTLTGHNWCSGMAGAGMNAEFNPDLLANPAKCLITSYISSNVSLFRCTADPRTGTYQGTDPTKLGTKVPAARTISMNQAVGTICPAFDAGGGHSGKPTLSVNGPWLDGAHGHRRNAPYRTYGKTSEMISPTPAQLWVLLEEDPLSLNDASFAVSIASAQWIDFPHTAHGGAGVFAFGDGHAELHKWADLGTRLTGYPSRITVPPTNLDWRWLADHTSARAK